MSTILNRIAQQVLAPSCESDGEVDIDLIEPVESMQDDTQLAVIAEQRAQLEDGVAAVESLSTLLESLESDIDPISYSLMTSNAAPALEMFGVSVESFLPSLEEEGTEKEAFKDRAQRHIQRLREFIAKLWKYMVAMIGRLFGFVNKVIDQIQAMKLTERERVKALQKKVKNISTAIPKEDEIAFAHHTKYLQTSYGIPRNSRELKDQYTKVHAGVRATVENIEKSVDRYLKTVPTLLKDLESRGHDYKNVKNEFIDKRNEALAALWEIEPESVAFPQFRGDEVDSKSKTVDAGVPTGRTPKLTVKFDAKNVEEYPAFEAMDARAILDAIATYETLIKSSNNTFIWLNRHRRNREMMELEFKEIGELITRITDASYKKLMADGPSDVWMQENGSVQDFISLLKGFSQQLAAKNAEVARAATRDMQGVVMSLQRFDSAYVNMLLVNARNLTDSKLN